MDGPFGMKMELRRMALRGGYSLDELDPSDGEGDDPKKAFIEDLMSCMGLTPEDLKHVYGDPGDEYSDDSEDEYSDDPEEDEELDPSCGRSDDRWSKYLDPSFKKKLDDVPPPPADKQMDDDVITYRRRGCKRSNDGEIKKKLDVPTPLVTTGAAAAAGDNEIKKEEDDVRRIRPHPKSPCVC